MINVKKVASLARLKLNENEESALQKNLSDVLKHFEAIAAISTEGIEPLITPTEIEQHWRADQCDKSITVQEALQNAPEKEGNLFKVPPVV
jgi:aspartyl-tRNA(Asn)/glutamyl-tRNA(Gln) amidotransferase subunit C